MKKKFPKDYNFIPESFLLPKDNQLFISHKGSQD